MKDVLLVDQLQMAIAFLLYMFVFAWIGWKRGAKRELIVFLTALFTLIFVRLKGDSLVQLANLGWKLLNGLLSGALSEGGDFDFGATPDLITTCPADQPYAACSSSGFLFLFWVSVVILAYICTSLWVKDSESNGWAIIVGIMNGFLYASVILPRLVSLIKPGAVNLNEPIILDTLVGLIRAAWTSITSVMAEIWHSLGAWQPYVFLLLLIILVVGAASTLHKPKKNGSSSSSSSEA